MTRYAVGDIQGCLTPLQQLLAQVHFDPKQDQLWLVGDLINRGPDSLDTLRYLKSLESSTRIVLGNHDLHFMAVAMGHKEQKRGDTFDALLSALDCDELVHWLRQFPLLYTDPSGDYTMIHAGIPPQWSLQEATARADEIAAILKSDRIHDFFDHMYGNHPDCWKDSLNGWERARIITNYLTRMRFCSADGTLDLHNKTDVACSADFAPWFSHQDRKTAADKIIFGHWASLEGKADTANIFALDTGCVWGGSLTLLNLETQQTHQCNCAS
jgi:bis(5'-nucleosyl)-tetraphosphatase (symmetrical)